MKFIILILNYISLIASFNIPFSNNVFVPRRDFLGNIIFSGTNLNLIDNIKNSIENKNKNIKREDKYAHWSIYGLVPPPIEKTINYENLVNSINNNTISYIEIAVQHDCIIGTTIDNHRWACLLPDSEIPKLINDTKDINGKQNVKIIPTNPTKVKIRNIAQIFFYIYIIRFITLDIPYNYKLIREINKMNMTFKEKMYYLSNKTTNLNIVDLFNDTFIK
tara:strand:+ start:7417 stop:8076 length:660 start_codon:yes stop_codon:yes gene_type:complete